MSSSSPAYYPTSRTAAISTAGTTTSVAIVKPVNAFSSLVRYELLVVCVWFFVEMARWYSHSKQRSMEDDEEVEMRKSKFSRTAWYVLLGAVLGVVLYWLIVDVCFYSAFHSPVQTQAFATYTVPAIAAAAPSTPNPRVSPRVRSY